jgi:uncharacterized delta-60 repeat protein
MPRYQSGLYTSAVSACLKPESLGRRNAAGGANRIRIGRRLVRASALLTLLVATGSATALAPGQDGVRVTIPISGISDVAQAVVVDPGGNIVLAGSVNSNGTAGGDYLVLARVTPSGALDSTFPGIGGNLASPGFPIIGIDRYDFSGIYGEDGLRALVRLDDGRYLACGTIYSAATSWDFLVARFNAADGSLDTSFNGLGYVVTAFAASGSGLVLTDQCNAVAVQANGMIVAAGVTNESGHHVAVVRYTASGVLDTTFGLGGKVDISAAAPTTEDSEARALVLQPDDGKLLIAGYAFSSGNSELLVMRLNADGSLDPSFGSGGITRTPVGSGEGIANAMVRQPDGRIVVAGSTYAAGGHRDFALARYTTAGVLDPTFGTGGVVTTAVGPSDAYAYALILMPWGRLVAAGSAGISTSVSNTDLALAAYNADGSLDRYFGNAGTGKVMVNTSASGNDIVYGLASDLSGARFWAVGTTYGSLTTAQDFLAIEFGLPDTIFRDGFEGP